MLVHVIMGHLSICLGNNCFTRICVVYFTCLKKRRRRGRRRPKSFFLSLQQQETLCWFIITYETDTDTAENSDPTTFPIHCVCVCVCVCVFISYDFGGHCLCFPQHIYNVIFSSSLRPAFVSLNKRRLNVMLFTD